MSEGLTRREPVPAEPVSGRDVIVRAAAPMARYALRARQASDVEKLLGRPVPHKIGDTDQGVFCLGPDEWLLLAPAGTALSAGEGAAVAVTEVSDRNIGIIVEGPRASEVLAAGCPLDFDRFNVGRATRTIFETAEVIILRDAADRFHVEVWRSFAPWLWTAFVTVASE